MSDPATAFIEKSHVQDKMNKSFIEFMSKTKQSVTRLTGWISDKEGDDVLVGYLL